MGEASHELVNKKNQVVPFRKDLWLRVSMRSKAQSLAPPGKTIVVLLEKVVVQQNVQNGIFYTSATMLWSLSTHFLTNAI